MSAAAGRHPSDAERAEAARPVLEELIRAAAAGDADAVAACLDESVAWLDAAGVAHGSREAAARLIATAGANADLGPARAARRPRPAALDRSRWGRRGVGRGPARARRARRRALTICSLII